ncbi:MAG: hypothetical protein GY847_22030 [Proteobacteria bacterium]|nr:hypothetical protein [Pseudomonadota bacterium]
MSQISIVLICALVLIGCGDEEKTNDNPLNSDDSSDIDSGTGKDTSSNQEPDSDSAEDAGLPCDAGCEKGEWTECTCDPSDPCGWSEDGMCAGYCIELGIVKKMFDDSKDCQGPCTGLCQGGVYLPCTCDPSDPCDWSEDDHCDDVCLSGYIVEEMFDDSADCG